jgi:mono/diheme cytochrome c family protein
MFGSLLALLAPECQRLSAQPDSANSQQRSGGQAPAKKAAAARQLFQEFCSKCHGMNGKGDQARSLFPEIPDFTAVSWHKQRSEALLQTSILNGKGKNMPSFAGKIDKDQSRALVGHVRAFAPGYQKAGPEKEDKKQESSPSGFEEEFRRLQEEMDKLTTQFRELSKDLPAKRLSKPAKSSLTPSQASTKAATGATAAPELFRQHCTKCHGVDGSGSGVRPRLPSLPKFNDMDWQSRRNDARLMASILDGKGKEMPPWRGKITEEQVRGLVAHIRALGRTQPQMIQGKTEPVEPAEVEPQGVEQLIGWLGSPAVVHFPIALLTAAAAAELLRMVSGRHSLNVENGESK